jgi:predicted metal-dependent hydrolase
MNSDPPHPTRQLDPRFLKGIELFNEREFFECHEVLEELWNDQQEPEKQLTQGILQIAVAYYHYLRGNYSGTCKLFHRAWPRISGFRNSADCVLDLEPFIEVVQKGLQILEAHMALRASSEGIEADTFEVSAQIEIPTIQFKRSEQ